LLPTTSNQEEEGKKQERTAEQWLHCTCCAHLLIVYDHLPGAVLQLLLMEGLLLVLTQPLAAPSVFRVVFSVLFECSAFFLPFFFLFFSLSSLLCCKSEHGARRGLKKYFVPKQKHAVPLSY
jgi:hypothetical protein